MADARRPPHESDRACRVGQRAPGRHGGRRRPRRALAARRSLAAPRMSAQPGALTVVLLLLESLPLILRRRFPLEVVLVVVSATIVHIADPARGSGLIRARGPRGDLHGRRAARSTARRSAWALTGGSWRPSSSAARASRGPPEPHPDRAHPRRRLAGRRRVTCPPALHPDPRAAAELLQREREERAAGDPRGARADRSRAPRCRRPSRQRHRDPGRRRAARHGEAPGRGAHGAGGHRVDRSPGPDRDAPLARHARRGRACRNRCPARPPRRPARPRPLRRACRSSCPCRASRRPLDPGLELSAYRIIQEGLTNSLKHAGGGRPGWRCATADRLEISIEDERGPGRRRAVEPAHDGRGLVGMRERVAMFRGTFAAQPTTTGFRVTARLPVEDAGPAL